MIATGLRSSISTDVANNPVRGLILLGKLFGPNAMGVGEAVGGTGVFVGVLVDVDVGVGVFVGGIMVAVADAAVVGANVGDGVSLLRQAVMKGSVTSRKAIMLKNRFALIMISPIFSVSR